VDSEPAIAKDVTSMITGVGQIDDRLVAGLHSRMTALSGVSAEIQSLRDAFSAAGVSPFLLIFQIILVVAFVTGVFILVSRRFRRATADRSFWRRFFAGVAAAILALLAGFIAARLLDRTDLAMRTLRVWTVVTVAGGITLFTVRHVLMASMPPAFPKPSVHMAALVRGLSIAIGWALLGIGLITTLHLWGAGPGLMDLTGSGLVGIPAFLLFVIAVWRNKRTMVVAVAGSRPRSHWRGRLARAWPAIVIGFLLVTFFTTEAAQTLGMPIPGSAILLTALIFIATPHLDTMISHWAQRGLESPSTSVAAAAGMQTARFAILVIMLALLETVWATPLAVGLGFGLQSVATNVFDMALIALGTAFLWNVIGTITGRALLAEVPTLGANPEALSAPRSRLGTLVPLLSGVGKSSILALAMLSVLVTIGVNVWPLITGLSVFGLAVGFGSQTLVKDVVSGLFFLIDDAFRFGEYIETSGAKGTVEKISIRSVSLRHQRGALATIPYGQIGKIQNYSRDWVIEKLMFRVAFDTDVELVRKLFKKIGQEIAQDPEVAEDLLEPFKSQGIAEVEDGTLVITAKFKAKAGKQTMIRRAVMVAVHRAFRENGIQAVSKPITSSPAPA
jgi:small-conductance mechanosensitive channel